jgi:aspartate aminotransferase-like enzyme
MNDDYFTRLDEQLSALTSEGAHLDRWARWRPIDRAARRTVAALGLVVLLAGLLVIEFPGSASGSEHRANTQAARTGHAARSTQATAGNLGSGPTASFGRLA